MGLRGITKRQKFALATVLAAGGLVGTQLITATEYYFPVAILYSFLSGIIAFFVLRTDAEGVRKISSIILITLYAAAVALFYSLLPVRWLTRLPTAALFGVGFYAILLTENIFNVSTGRTIQLLRAARSIGLLLTLLTLFLFYETIYSLHLAFYSVGGLVFLVSFPLAFQNLWQMELKTKLKGKLILWAALMALVVSQIGTVLSFWPAETTMRALFLTSFYYLVVGISQQELIDRLFPKTQKEFLIVSGMIFLLFFLTASWTG